MKTNIFPIPFTTDFLATHFGLNLGHILEASFVINEPGSEGYTIKFDTAEHANDFYQIMQKICALWLDTTSSSVILRYDENYTILKAAKIYDTSNIAPFNLDFLSKYYDLNKEQVKKVGEDTAIGKYVIYFHQRDDSELFYNHLIQLGLHPKFYFGDNSVTLTCIESFSYLQKAAIKVDAQNQTSVKTLPLSPYKPSTQLFDQLSSSSKSSIQQNLAKNDPPFNLTWLSQNFGLDITKVKKDALDFLGMYTIYFHDLDSAKQFFNKMNTTGCNPRLWDFNNSVELNRYTKDAILRTVGSIDSIPSASIETEESSQSSKSISQPRNYSFFPSQEVTKPSEVYIDRPEATVPTAMATPTLSLRIDNID